MTYRCLKLTEDHHFEEYNVTAVCAKAGKWEPSYDNVCTYFSGKHKKLQAQLYPI